MRDYQSYRAAARKIRLIARARNQVARLTNAGVKMAERDFAAAPAITGSVLIISGALTNARARESANSLPRPCVIRHVIRGNWAGPAGSASPIELESLKNSTAEVNALSRVMPIA